ncbi:MAG: UvrB/UvrC motif-containing protein [Clostridia bacterium]|nr:UvrB/UvrC motif-containing protein [Clostridia bacterium]
MGEWATPILKVGATRTNGLLKPRRPRHASKLLEFEHAALLRDRIKELQQMQ